MLDVFEVLQFLEVLDFVDFFCKLLVIFEPLRFCFGIFWFSNFGIVEIACDGEEVSIQIYTIHTHQAHIHTVRSTETVRSLGMVLYAMCFSSLPFSHDDPHVVKAGQEDEC